MSSPTKSTTVGPRPVVLVLTVPPNERELAAERESELKSLLDTAGRTVVATLTQHLAKPHNATYLGSGKIVELKALMEQHGAEEAAFDVQLSPRQQRNLEKELEADVIDGVRAVKLSKYAGQHTRICRPVGLSDEDREKLVSFMTGRLGMHYDIKNAIDLIRYLLPQPPVPVKWRRRMLALGSGDPTRAICSTLIAQAFQSIRYPILPEITVKEDCKDGEDCAQAEIMHIRHHSLFTPRDFDISPYFRVIKPTLEAGFDYKSLEWGNIA